MKTLITSRELKALVPNYCDTITTKIVAARLGISTKDAYALCCAAVEEGWLWRLGYKSKDSGGGYEDPQNSNKQFTSLTWQNVINPESEHGLKTAKQVLDKFSSDGTISKADAEKAMKEYAEQLLYQHGIDCINLVTKHYSYVDKNTLMLINIQSYLI